jgi:hypothetical protein
LFVKAKRETQAFLEKRVKSVLKDCPDLSDPLERKDREDHKEW